MHSMRNISLSLMRRHRNWEILYSLRNLLALSGLPTEWLTSAVAMQEEKIDDLAVDVEIPLLVRTFRTDGTQVLVVIDAFTDPETARRLNTAAMRRHIL